MIWGKSPPMHVSIGRDLFGLRWHQFQPLTQNKFQILARCGRPTPTKGRISRTICWIVYGNFDSTLWSLNFGASWNLEFGRLDLFRRSPPKNPKILHFRLAVFLLDLDLEPMRIDGAVLILQRKRIQLVRLFAFGCDRLNVQKLPDLDGMSVFHGLFPGVGRFAGSRSRLGQAAKFRPVTVVDGSHEIV